MTELGFSRKYTTINKGAYDQYLDKGKGRSV